MSDSRELIDCFLNHCELIQSLSTNTIQAYRQDLLTLTRFLKTENEIHTLPKERILEFLSHLKTVQGNSATTIRRRWNCIRLFYSWLEDQKIIERSPYRDMDVRIKVPKQLPRALSQTQLKEVIGQTARTHTPIECDPSSKDLQTNNVKLTADLTIRLMAATGIRVGELSSLRLQDVSQDAQSYQIRGKGSRERMVYVVNDDLRQDLQRYLEKRISEAGNFDEPLFINRNRAPLTPQTIRLRLKKMSEDLNSPTRITPHRFRHTAATLLLDEGVDIRFVQRLLGHSSISTTEIYTHVTDESLRNTLKQADPMAKLR